MPRRLGSVRARTTLAATLVVGVALAVAAVGFIAVLRNTMIDNVDTGLELRADDIAALIEGGTPLASVAIKGDEDGFVQLIDPEGRVVASSSNVEGEGPVAVSGDLETFNLDETPVEEGTFRVHITTTSTAFSTTIVVGRSLADVQRTLSVVTWTLALGGPALLALVAVTTWMVAGRALSPVENIRSQVASIGGSDLHRRVPQPQSDDEIGRLAETMNAMLERLEAASDRQRRFVSDASHELRTPLATTQHQIELARRNPHDDPDGVLAELGEDNLRIQHLVDDLLLLARQDEIHAKAAKALTDHVVVDLDDIALVEAHRIRNSTKSIDTTGLAEAQVNGDSGQLTRVIRNLADNAITHANTRVTITADTTGDKVVLAVEDDGPGVAEADRDRIFERFTRADDARARRDGGAGLGLAIVHDLVTHHHGTIAVDTSPGLGGARFAVTLPAAQDPSNEPPQPHG